MDRTIGQGRRVRVANFSRLELPLEHCLDLHDEDHDGALRQIRRHADLPYVFVASGEQAGRVKALLSALGEIRSPCYPYALFSIGRAELDVDEGGLDLCEVENDDPAAICQQLDDYLASRLSFDRGALRLGSSGALPARTEVVIVGAGVTGLYAAEQLREAGIGFCILEQAGAVGGIWSAYANSTSQVNTSECAYRLFDKRPRSNSDHSSTREILEDLALLSSRVSERLFLETAVRRIERTAAGYRIEYSRGGEAATLESRGVLLAINDRVGTPREVEYENRSAFRGELVSGISDDARSVDWRDKRVVVVGMGAFAVENVRTALEGGARQVTVVCRRHGTICPKIIDYLNFVTPYDDEFRHPKKSNTLNMMYWKKLYELSGARQPECWMGKIKHDGHTISVSDLWFIAHFLKKLETRTGETTSLTEGGVIVDGRHHVEADLVVSCVGFERSSPLARSISGFAETYNNNFVDKGFMYLADAYIDADAFNSLFGSSVLEMVKFYVDLFIRYYDSPDYEAMISTPGIERVPIEDRKWTDAIQAAMALIRRYPEVREVAERLVAARTRSFLEVHDLETYVAENKREWIETHARLAGRPLAEEECLPYVFERLLKARG